MEAYPRNLTELEHLPFQPAEELVQVVIKMFVTDGALASPQQPLDEREDAVDVVTRI